MRKAQESLRNLENLPGSGLYPLGVTPKSFDSVLETTFTCFSAGSSNLAKSPIKFSCTSIKIHVQPATLAQCEKIIDYF